MPQNPETVAPQNLPAQDASKDTNAKASGGGSGSGNGDALNTGLSGDQLAKGGASSPETEEQKKAAEEEKKKEIFKKRNDIELKNHIPGTGMGKFDAKYSPAANQLDITLKLCFDFLDANETPGWFGRLLDRAKGNNTARFFWSDTEKKEYVDKFKSRVGERWSKKHIIKSIKKYWEEFSATTVVTVQDVPLAQKDTAHFYIKAHKVTGDNGIEYKSAVNNENLLNPATQPTADLYSSDNTENPNFNSRSVATTERQRIEAAIASTGSGRVLFEKSKSEISPVAKGSLSRFSAELKKVRPHDPRIPVEVKGFASPEGDASFNQRLANERAAAVRNELQGVPQPVNASFGGVQGAENDPQERRAEISADRTFETTYQGNAYSVSEHEAGHMLGMPDEYIDVGADPNAHPALQQAQVQYEGLVRSAGLEATTYGQNTSSQMSNGVDIMPSHYVTFWEALGKMTDPDIKQGEWKLGG